MPLPGPSRFLPLPRIWSQKHNSLQRNRGFGSGQPLALTQILPLWKSKRNKPWEAVVQLIAGTHSPTPPGNPELWAASVQARSDRYSCGHQLAFSGDPLPPSKDGAACGHPAWHFSEFWGITCQSSRLRVKRCNH